ncbi:DUF262 domain-containing protein [Maricaulis salignorans]|uniref:DUF262 domain-containing protein n=1 Tax=Maricaulis salignorans TaxID=144026 RepID=UPI003A8EF774
MANGVWRKFTVSNSIADLEIDDGVETESELAEPNLEHIADPFNPLDIKISRRVITVEQIVRRIRHHEIDLAPDFQRRARVWDIIRKTRLIESVLLRIPLPVFYFSESDSDEWQVVDGLQRLTTLSDFMGADDHKFKLRGLEYLSEYEGFHYEELPRSIIRRIDETELNVNIIEFGTPDEVMFNIFRRLNTGGMTLNAQEIRHAINPGHARNFLLNLAESREFLDATDGSIKDHRMAARELALRYLAFTITPHFEYESADLHGFLNHAMRLLNGSNREALASLEAQFKLSMVRSKSLFGNQAFRKPSLEQPGRNPINRALFESVAVGVGKISDERFQNIMHHRDEFFQQYLDLFRFEEEFIASISQSTGSISRVHTRFETINQLFSRATL